MPNRLSLAKRERRLEEKVRQAEEKFEVAAQAKRRKHEKRAQRLAERKAVATGELTDAQEFPEFTAPDDACMLSELQCLLSSAHQQNSEIVQIGAELAEEPIDVLVQCMTGEEFWLTPLPQDSVAQLKCMLSDVWGIPSQCQQLLLDCKMLHDSEQLIHYMKDDEKRLSCTAVVAVGEVRDGAVLAKLVVRGSEGVMNAVFHLMGSEDEGTRYQMFSELRKIAEKGDSRVASVLIEILNRSTLPCLKIEILETLACVGPHNENVKVEIIARLQDTDASVRVAALQGLSHFVARAFLISIHAVSECLEDVSEDVRFQAVQVLADIAARGNADILIEEVQLRLEHARGAVRRAAAQALSRIVAQGDDRSVDLFITLLADSNADVRAAAVQAIDCVADPHSVHAFNALVDVLFDPDGIVRQLTLRSLKRFARKSDRLLVITARPFLKHPDPILRHTAVEALGAVEKSFINEGAISDMRHLLSDSDALVRSSVARVLCDPLKQ